MHTIALHRKIRPSSGLWPANEPKRASPAIFPPPPHVACPSALFRNVNLTLRSSTSSAALQFVQSPTWLGLRARSVAPRHRPSLRMTRWRPWRWLIRPWRFRQESALGIPVSCNFHTPTPNNKDQHDQLQYVSQNKVKSPSSARLAHLYSPRTVPPLSPPPLGLPLTTITTSTTT